MLQITSPKFPLLHYSIYSYRYIDWLVWILEQIDVRLTIVYNIRFLSNSELVVSASSKLISTVTGILYSPIMAPTCSSCALVLKPCPCFCVVKHVNSIRRLPHDLSHLLFKREDRKNHHQIKSFLMFPNRLTCRRVGVRDWEAGEVLLSPRSVLSLSTRRPVGSKVSEDNHRLELLASSCFHKLPSGGMDSCVSDYRSLPGGVVAMATATHCHSERCLGLRKLASSVSLTANADPYTAVAWAAIGNRQEEKEKIPILIFCRESSRKAPFLSALAWNKTVYIIRFTHFSVIKPFPMVSNVDMENTTGTEWSYLMRCY